MIPFPNREKIITDDSLNYKHSITKEERKGTQSFKVYSVKLKHDQNVMKVRKFYLRTQEERTAFIGAILKA